MHVWTRTEEVMAHPTASIGQGTLTRTSVDDAEEKPASIAVARFSAGVFHPIGHTIAGTGGAVPQPENELFHIFSASLASFFLNVSPLQPLVQHW